VLGLTCAALLAATTQAEEPDELCPVPNPPGVPSTSVPGLGVEGLNRILVAALSQDPWVVSNVDSNNVSIRRPLGEDSSMRQGWEDIHGEQADAEFFHERRWMLEPRFGETVVTIRDYLVIISPKAQEQRFEYKSAQLMGETQCVLEEIRQIAVDNEVVPERENSL
jgi:hypothetical protein